MIIFNSYSAMYHVIAYITYNIRLMRINMMMNILLV